MSKHKTVIDRKFGVRQILPLCLILISIAWIAIAMTEYGFWNDITGPTSGFMPILIATVLLICSSIALFLSFGEEKPSFKILAFVFILLMFALIGISLLIGLVPAMLLYVLLWLRLIEKAPWKGTIILLLFLAALAYGMFQIWLHVPFPNGILFEMLF